MTTQLDRDFTRREILLIYTGLLSAMLLSSLDLTIVSTALPRIVGELGGLSSISWLVTAYMLASTVSTPIWGKLSDLYGRRPLFLAAISIFILGSVASGFSQNIGQLIGARGLQGLGGGGLFAQTMIIVADVVPPRKRGRYQGIMMSVWGVSSIAGPLVGGALAAHWRWIFFINVPVGALSLYLVNRNLRIPTVRREHSIDYLGAALLVAGVSSALLMTVWGGSKYGWGSSIITGLGAFAVLSIVAFIRTERRSAEPIISLGLFNNPTFRVTASVAFLGGLGMFGTIVYMPVFLQIVLGATPTNSGFLTLPMMAGIMTASTGSGWLVSKTGRYKAFIVAGAGTLVCGIFLLSRMTPQTTRLQSALFMFLVGAGLGMQLGQLILALQVSVQKSELGSATSTQTFIQNIGGSFGTALFGAIMTNGLAARLDPLSASVPGGNLRNLTNPVVLGQLPEALRNSVRLAVAGSITRVFVVVVPFTILAFIATFFLRERTLSNSVIESAAIDGGLRA